MKRSNTCLLSFGIAFLILLVIVLPLGVAVAQDGSAPTPTRTSGGLGDLIIPTATPGSGGGFTIPTATPASGGGFVIPTSTPAATDEPAGPSFSALDDAQLTDLNLRPSDVPANFAASQAVTTFNSADTVAQLAEYSTELADQFEAMTTTYGWTRSIGVSYTACQPDLPISEIYSEVAQLKSVEAGRALFNDPDAQAVFASLGYTIEPAANVNGWLMSLPPGEGACFAQEVEYSLNFDYWGLLLTVSMTANAETDPGLVIGLLDQIAPILVAHADALAGSPFPATPVPGSEAMMLPTPTAEIILPPTVPAPTPTTPVIVPSGPTLRDVENAMPTTEELGLTDYTLNTELSQAYTTQEWVDFWQSLGLSALASALDRNARQNGMLGQITRVWDTAGTCPPGMATSLEIDINLFETANGAQAFLFDPGYLQAMGSLGVMVEYSGDALISSLVTPTECGSMMTYAKTIADGPFLIGSSVIVYSDTDRAEVLEILDVVNDYMRNKLADVNLN